MKSLLSQFTFLDCLRLSGKRLEFSPFSPSPHPSNLGTEAQASTALAHGQAEALKKNKKTRENVCRDLKREETFCDSLDFTCNWKTTWGSFMACSAGCWDLYRSWWFSSRQGWVCLHILYTVYNRISTVYLCKRYNTYFGHMFGRFDSPHCDHCKFFQGMAAAARSVFFVMCLLVRHQKLNKHHHLGNRGFRLSRTQVLVLYVFSIAFTQLAAGTVMGSFYFPTAWELRMGKLRPRFSVIFDFLHLRCNIQCIRFWSTAPFWMTLLHSATK